MEERRKIFALVLILLGITIFAGNFIPVFSLKIIWPIFIIIIGLGLMFKEIHHS